MALPAQNIWFSRLITFAIGAVAAASGAFWALKFSSVAKTKPSVSIEAQLPVDTNFISVASAEVNVRLDWYIHTLESGWKSEGICSEMLKFIFIILFKRFKRFNKFK